MNNLLTATALALALGAGGVAWAQSGAAPADGGAMAKVGACWTQGEAATDRDKIFARLDADDDGAISKAEYGKCESRASASRADDGAQPFAAIDADGDGKIAKAEFAAAVQRTAASTGEKAGVSAGASASGSSGASSSAETVRRADSGGSSASPSATTTGRDTTRSDMTAQSQKGPDAASTRSSTATAAGSSAAANAMMGMKAQELIGRDVVNAAGKEVGEIDDIVINDQDKAVYAVVGVGGFLGIGEKNVAIPFDQLRLGADNVILMSEKGEGELKEMPAYKKGQWKSLERGQAIESR